VLAYRVPQQRCYVAALRVRLPEQRPQPAQATQGRVEYVMESSKAGRE